MNQKLDKLLEKAMTLNNRKSVINLKIVRRSSLIITAAFILLTYIARIIKYPILGVGQGGWTMLIIGCFLVILILPLILHYQYIFYSDEGNTIIIRYYSTGFPEGSKNSIEIDKKTFAGFILDKQFLGLSQSLTLFQRQNKTVGKYPPVFISALKRKDKAKVLASLSSYAPMIKEKTKGSMS